MARDRAHCLEDAGIFDVAAGDLFSDHLPPPRRELIVARLGVDGERGRDRGEEKEYAARSVRRHKKERAAVIRRRAG